MGKIPSEEVWDVKFTCILFFSKTIIQWINICIDQKIDPKNYVTLFNQLCRLHRLLIENQIIYCDYALNNYKEQEKKHKQNLLAILKKINQINLKLYNKKYVKRNNYVKNIIIYYENQNETKKNWIQDKLPSCHPWKPNKTENII
ncbi:TPA: hypothetical protein ACGW44_005043 [Bacillus toyonensis]